MTSHTGTNAPKHVHSRWGWPPSRPTHNRLCKLAVLEFTDLLCSPLRMVVGPLVNIPSRQATTLNTPLVSMARKNALSLSLSLSGWLLLIPGRTREACNAVLGKTLTEGWGMLSSGTKKEPKPKLLSPDIFWWGGGLPREGVGAKKFGMSLKTQGMKLFWRDIPGFCRDIPEAPEKFEKKMFGFSFWPLH